MITTLDLITDAATTAGVTDPRESLSDADAQFILRRLNRMIESWANERLMIYVTHLDDLPLQAGVGAYSSALILNGNATQWDSAFVRVSNIDHPLELVDLQTYQAIPDKSVQGIPRLMFPHRNWPATFLYFFPVPYMNMTATIAARKQRPDPDVVLTTTIDLPPGYEAAIVDNLAVDISPSFGMQPSPQLVETARYEKMVIKRNNRVALEMDLPFTGRGTFDIYAG